MLNSYDFASVLTNFTGNTALYNDVENALFTSFLRLVRDGYNGAVISNELQLLMNKLTNSVVIYDNEYNRIVAIIENGFECYFDGLQYPVTSNERFTVISGWKLLENNGIVNTMNELENGV